MKKYHLTTRPLSLTAMMLTAMMLLGGACSLPAVEPVSIVSDPSIENPRQPQLALDENGTIYVAFASESSIYFCKSSDGGKSYSAPAKVATLPKLALGMRRGPRIAASGQSVVITAISHETGNVTAWQSSDAGQSWSSPTVVNDASRSAREGLHDMAMGPGEMVFCTWLDLRSGKTQIFGARSTDGGQSWGENQLIYASPSGTVCECCHPSVAIDGNGSVYVMWRNSLEGNRDMFLAISEDGGRNFGKASKLGTGTWRIDRCPMDGGYLAVGRQGELTTVWRREKQVLRSGINSRTEQQLGPGEQPWAAATADGPYLVWLNRRGGDLWLSTPNSRKPTKLASGAADPVIAASASEDRPVVAVWEVGAKPVTSIMAAVVSP